MKTTTDPLRVLTFGAGALGTYIGGSLALSGHEVVFIERPEVASELSRRSLRLNLGGQEFEFLEPSVVDSLDEALLTGPFDVAIFALKSFDTTVAINSFSHFVDKMPPLLCLQNGVENEPRLAQALGAEKVIAGTVTSAIGKRAPGNIILERLRGIGVFGGHPLSRRLLHAFNEAGLNGSSYPNALDMKWSKMLTNLVANATSAILNFTPAQVFAHPGAFHLEIAQLRETLAVMRAQGIKLVDLPGTPVRALAFAARRLPLALSRPLLKRAVAGGRGAKMPSFHIDLHSRRGKSEVDYLNGAVVRAGQQVGVPIPVNQLLTQTLIQMTRAEIPLDQFSGQPEKLLALL